MEQKQSAFQTPISICDAVIEVQRKSYFLAAGKKDYGGEKA